MRYRIEYSDEASEDIGKLLERIAYKYLAPKTAIAYSQGLIDKIKILHTFPKSFAIITHPILLLQYGGLVRSINYKNEVVLYSVYEEHNLVWIHRVAPAVTLIG
ncbi:MAG: hypothetical protein LBM68_02940 [Bacteroidales bacterium]|jgi:hypothetical protein|nr:hypothetical protein [Bacteroidales bacterium]